MVDVHPVTILKQGAETWNAWRETHKDLAIDFSSMDLSNLDLRGVNLRQANLRFTDLSESNLTLANLRDADLRFSSLCGATLQEATLKSANLRDANLNDADLCCSDLRFTNLSSADLLSVNLGRANLNSANLISSDLRFADLSSADLSSADLSATNLSSVNLRGATLLETNMYGADLTRAVLTGACIQDWLVDEQTILDHLICDYIFLKVEWDPEQQGVIFRERLPEHEDQVFPPGDCVQWIRRTNIITINLVFDKINWHAFHQALTQVRSIYGSDMILLQGINTTQEGSIEIRINAPLADIETQLSSTYDQVLNSDVGSFCTSQSTSFAQMDWIVEVLSEYCHKLVPRQSSENSP